MTETMTVTAGRPTKKSDTVPNYGNVWGKREDVGLLEKGGHPVDGRVLLLPTFLGAPVPLKDRVFTEGTMGREIMGPQGSGPMGVRFRIPVVRTTFLIMTGSLPAKAERGTGTMPTIRTLLMMGLRPMIRTRGTPPLLRQTTNPVSRVDRTVCGGISVVPLSAPIAVWMWMNTLGCSARPGPGTRLMTPTALARVLIPSLTVMGLFRTGHLALPVRTMLNPTRPRSARPPLTEPRKLCLSMEKLIWTGLTEETAASGAGSEGASRPLTEGAVRLVRLETGVATAANPRPTSVLLIRVPVAVTVVLALRIRRRVLLSRPWSMELAPISGAQCLMLSPHPPSAVLHRLNSFRVRLSAVRNGWGLTRKSIRFPPIQVLLRQLPERRHFAIREWTLVLLALCRAFIYLRSTGILPAISPAIRILGMSVGVRVVELPLLL